MKLPPAGKKASATDSSVENERSARTALFWNDGKASKLCLPVELFEDNSLEKLTIGYYDEVEIPDAIRNSRILKILEIHNSNLISIPEAIYDLTSLEELSLTNGSTYWAPGGINEITEVSPKILQLKNLKRLELDPYYIKVPPRDVVERGSMPYAITSFR